MMGCIVNKLTRRYRWPDLVLTLLNVFTLFPSAVNQTQEIPHEYTD